MSPLGVGCLAENIDIDRPPEAVWPYITEPDHIQVVANLEAIEQQSGGQVEKGTRWRQTMRLMGKKVQSTDEAIEVEKDHRLVVRSIDSPFPYTLGYTLEATEQGTAVTLDADFGDTGTFFGRLTRPVVAKFMEHEVRGQLERLKTVAEAETL